MTEDERIVREAVIDPVLEKNAGNGWIHYWVRYGKVSIFNPDGSGFDSASEAWSAARAFTDEHREQIRQAERDVAMMENAATKGDLISDWWHGTSDDSLDSCLVRYTRDHVSICRILAREQAALAELKRGWKTGE